jgi:hypothetical protein
MSGYLQYSNYGEDETPPLKPAQPMKPAQHAQHTQPAQPMKPAQPTQTTHHKRTLRANQRILRSTQPTNSSDQIQPNPQTKYAQDLIKRMHNTVSGSDSDSDTESNEQGMQRQFQTEPGFNHTMYAPANSTDLNAKLNPASAKEGFASKTLANATPKQYPQYMPSVFQASNDPENKDAMLQKLDHIIALLEDQHDEKTGHVTEELILYCFLGVFIIFIVDSFARAGKYVR